MPQANRLKALMYVQKLQENWSDTREKTNVILEFEGYLNEIKPTDLDSAINLLESLLVEGQNDQSEKSITFNALKNLIPQNIVCVDLSVTSTGSKSDAKTCYEQLIEKLETIKSSSIVEQNKAL